MPFVKRNEQGGIAAVSQSQEPGFDEELAADDLELAAYIAGLEQGSSSLSATDSDFVRVLEDVVQLLVDKSVILFTDLPESAQKKMLYRQRLRSKMGEKLDLLGDD
ncbi:MAG: hypothetical protein ACJA09_004098 [Alcanivorax sp.]|jgi:hypothetical protein